MAQNIQLKRSALSGKVPDTGSLNLGELAVNTYDGKVFIKRSGSIESIQELITTNAINTGSITLTQTGSFGELVVTQDANIQNDLYVTNDIIANGDLDILGNITGSNLLIKGTLTAQSYIVSSSVVNMTTQFASGSTIFGNTSDDTHQFTGSVQISGSLTSSLQQGYIWVGNNNNVSVLVPTSSITVSLPNGLVSGSSQLTSSYDARYALSGTIGSQFYKKVETFTATAGQVTFTTAALMSAGNVDVFVNGAKLPPDEFTITSTNTLNLTNAALAGELIDIEMFSAFGGTIGYFELTGIPQGIISGSQQLTSSYDIRYALSGSGVSVAAGTVSGSSQLTSSYDVRYVLSGSITQTTWDNIASKPGGIISGSSQLPAGLVSGSSQLTSSYDTRYAASASYLTSLNGAISGSSQLTSSYDIRYALSGSGGGSIPAGTVSGSSQLTSSYDTRYALSGSAGSTQFYKTTQIFTASAGQTSFTVAGIATAGNVDVFVNGTKLVQTDFTIPDTHTITLVTGSITGQIVDIQTFNTYAVTTTAQGGGKLHTQTTPASTWTFAHNLGVQYPNVTVYNSSNQIIIPSSITANTVDLITLEFGTAVAGYAVVGIGGIIDAEGKTAKQQFTSSLEWRFEHKLGDRFIAIQTFNNSYEMIIPQNITLTDVTSSTITFPTPVAGWAVGTIGGGLPAISSSNAGNYLRVSQTAPYTASWIPAVDITVTNAITASHLNPISQSLVPAFSGTYDLGSVSKPWRHIYVGTGSIYLVDDTATITKAITANTIVTTTDIASGSINLASSLPSGIVSHSAQLNNTTIANLTITNLTTVNQTASVVFSSGSNRFGDFGNDTHQFTGSVQISGSITTLGSSTATSFSGAIAATNGVVSGSSQITFSGISSLPTLVSGSSQVTYANISSIPAGIVSGSSQITYANISSIPGGIVSGSSQVTLSSTTGYGSVLNQAVLTTSSPTFAGVTMNGSIGKTYDLMSEGTFGYSATYKTLKLGSTSVSNPQSIAFGVDLSGNAGSSFSGYGTEYYFRNVGSFKTPNAANNEYNTLFNWNSSGQITFNQNATFSGTITGNASTATSAATLTTARTINGTSFDGSANITIPSLVSGSSQVTLSSTTGYGSVLNQALLTSSSPSFVGLSLSGNLLLNNGGYGWIYGNDVNHSIIIRGDRTGAAADYTNYYQYGGNISAGKGHKFWTGGVLASQTLKFHIADDYTYNVGNMTIGGTLTENSSIRYKDNVETIKYGLDKVLQMRGVSYTKKDTGIKEIGLIAEELNEIIPDLVIKNEEGLCDSVSYGRITAVLIEAIKDLKKEIEDLKANR